MNIIPSSSDLPIFKTVLANGLTVIVKPNHVIPEVDVQLWYNVGSKHESDSQRGMAHLIEHMIFKGTQSLFSEGDLDGIIHKLAGSMNAFTSYDYTAYVFTLPSNSWHYALLILADCMQNARFDEQMLNSEFKAVIAELKMYRDNYQSAAIEQLMDAALSPHPYHHPIIGYKDDLWNMQRDDLFAFYKQHYHPGNAILILVGDVDPKEVVKRAEEYFGAIPSQVHAFKKHTVFQGDIGSKEVILYRQVSQPWCCYAYRIPGAQKKTSHLWYLLALLLGRGKSSRLYQRLVQELNLATEVDCFDYSLFEDQLLFISVVPVDEDAIPLLEEELALIIADIAANGCADWELAMIKKKAQVDYISLLESNEHFASSLGQTYLATGELVYFEEYIEYIDQITSGDLKRIAQEYLRPTLQYRAYVHMLPKTEELYAQKLQQESDALDAKILAQRTRTTVIEGPRYALSVQEPPLSDFVYPKPAIFSLDNGLEVYWFHNPRLPQISLQLYFKANYHYESKEAAGLSHFHSKMLLEGTQQRDAASLHRFLEERGIDLDSDSGVLHADFLSSDLSSVLDIIAEIVTQPKFSLEGIEKVRDEVLSDIREFWDVPMSFVSQQ